tara:strand:+ start:4051 stop:5475 length:1425 start_codon:yes stop_codon:yes gene_type:complete
MTSIQRLEVFNKAFNEYKIAKDNYINELDKAYSPDRLGTIIDNHNADLSFLVVDDNIVKTGDNIVMSKNSNNLFENTISGDEYYSNMRFQGEGTYSNTFVQVGLDINDIFKYQDESKYNNTQSYNLNLNSLKNYHKFNLNDGEGQECNLTDLERCDAYAKMNNNQYYGIGIGDSSDCFCYVMDELPDISSNKINTNTIDSINYGSETGYAVIFDISNEKYRVGENLSKGGYIGYDGKYYEITGEYTTDSIEYEEYSGNMCYYCSEDCSNNIDDCSSNECIGYFKNDYKTIYITNDNKKWLYSCTDNNDSNKGIYYHKKYSLNKENYPNCVNTPEKTKIISYDYYKNNLKDNKSSGTNISCGLDHLLKDNKTNVDSLKTKLYTKLEYLIKLFNELSKDELNMIYETNINMYDMNIMIREYKLLQEEIIDKKNRITTIDSQKNDKQILYKSMQYKSAAIGLTTIVAIIALFHVLKK